MSSLSKITFIILTILIVVACYHNEEVNNPVKIRKSSKYKFEIEISIHNEGRGNVHQMDPSKYEFDDSEWIYVNADSGRINYSEMVLSRTDRNETEYPWIQSNLRGYIEIKKDRISINLKLPLYEDQDTIVDSWSSYEYNGTYKLERKY